MKKKLLTGLMISAFALPIMGTAIPAHADKGPVALLYTDGHFKNDNLLSSCSKPKECAPWAQLPAWPAPAGSQVTSVGGHFHAAIPARNPVPSAPSFQKISLASENITYDEQLGCAQGVAAGSLFLDIGVDTALPDHGNTRKALGVEYDINYNRVGGAAILTGSRIDGVKNETIVALLVFHPKLAGGAAELANRCVPPPFGPAANTPLKVYFDVIGLLVNPD